MTTTLTEPTVGHVVVRDGMDYGSFFWTTGVGTTGDGRPRNWATWCAVSSYGTFGHHWYHIGPTFAEFAGRVGDDYLLGKIARMEFDADKFTKWMRREIFTSAATKEEKVEAYEAFKEILSDCSGESISVMAYASDEISRCDPCWSDCESRSYDRQAVMFVQKLWPKFAAHLAESQVAP